MKKILIILIILIYQLNIYAQSDNKLLIKTKYGFIKGKKDKNNTLVWKGIPYAKAPLDELRWKAPVEPDAREGILKAKKFSNAPMQYHAAFKKKIFGNEDCLYLNIWKPEEQKEKLPVYVWIHGGGNSIGYGHQLYEYYGHEIASRSQVVFVSINYRLGPFGWLSHPALQNSDNPADNSGNFGTLDIIQALKWIQENIEAFGGDPKRVMITGESAGAINIQSLLISPLAKGLFSSALSQSGLPKTGKINESKEFTEDIIKQLLIKNKIVKNKDEAGKKLRSMTNKEINDFLYSQEAKDIMKCVHPHLLGMIDMPFIFPDGFVIPENGYGVLETGEHVNKVPLLIGCNTNEMKLFIYFSKEPHWKDSVYKIATTYSSDMWKAKGVDYLARKLSVLPNQPPVYAYLFNYGNPNSQNESPLKRKWGEKLGAHHMSEIKFFLGTDKKKFALFSLLNKRKYQKGRDSLTYAMMSYAENMAYFGNPNNSNDNLPKWSEWNNENSNKGIILDAGKERAIIKELDYELFPEELLEKMNSSLNDEQKKVVKNFLFIFE